LENNIIYLVQQLLKKNHISFDSKELSFQIEGHPSFPSLHAITGVLDHFTIDNLAIDVTINENILSQLPSCFLAQEEIDGIQNFVTVIRNKSDYTVVRSAKEKRGVNYLELSSMLTGIVVAVEKTTNQEILNKKTSIEKKIIPVVFLIALVGLLFSSVFTVLPIIYLTLSVSGLFLSIAIVKQELGLQTSIGNAFCSETNDKKNCNAVLDSKGATLFKTIKLSDLSIVYFSALSILSFLFIVQEEAFSLLYGMGFIAYPIVIYALLYQKFKVKQWCMLCLLISALMLGQVVLGIIQYPLFFEVDFTLNIGLTICVVFSGVLLGLRVVKPVVEELKILKQGKLDAFKFKRNFSLFRTLLQKSSPIDTELLEASEIIFGNPQSSLEIIIITNPFCGHCKEIHLLVEDLMNRFSNNLMIKIRFNVNTKEGNSEVVKITSKLLEIYEIEGSEVCMKALNDIYGDVSSDMWMRKWGECIESKKFVDGIEMQSAWCRSNNINFTPEILINGIAFPREYDRKDLVYFIEDLNEMYQETNLVSI